MNKSTYKAIGCLGFLLVNGYYISAMDVISPKSEITVYKAMIGQLPDKMLVQKYKEQYEQLQQTFKDTAKGWKMSEDMSQLPIFKIAVFKVILAEIKKREKAVEKGLLPAKQLNDADKLLLEVETKFGTKK
jgi:hypothetical protein